MSDWHTSALLEGSDAYADWARTAGRPYVRAFDREGCLVPVLITLSEGCRPEDFLRDAEALASGDGADAQPCHCLPAFSRRGGGTTETARYVSVLVTEAFLSRLSGDDLCHAVQQILVGQRVSESADDHPPHAHRRESPGPEEEGAAADRGYEPGTVVMGVIDDAIAFAHERFRTADGKSRVEFAWLQDCGPGHRNGAGDVHYGRELTKDEIDDLLGACKPAGRVDEDRLYRKAGLIDFSQPGPKPAAWRVAHGTHVMDLACGYKPGEADQTRPIVCVQLPAAVTADTSGAGLEPHLVSAIEYILDRADRIAARNPDVGRLPVVINFSYGFQAGPHDGTHPIELAIDQIVESRRREAPVAVVLPSGNSHLARCHAEVSFREKGEEVTLDWRIQPDDSTSTFLEIWLPHTGKRPAASRVKLSVEPPGEPSDEPADCRDENVKWLGEEDRQARVLKRDDVVICKTSYEYVEASGRGRFLVAVVPTAFQDAVDEDGSRPTLAPSGLWRVTLTNKSLKPGETVHLWIQRDDTPHGYPVRGRQSYFEDEDYERFDPQGRVVVVDNDTSKVRRAGSMNAIATGRHPVVIGGFVRKAAEPARYSAGGPIVPPAGAEALHRCGPDVVAVSDNSEVHSGVLAAGSRSGSVVAMNGTSVAAPQVARWIADHFAAASGASTAPPRPGTPEAAVIDRVFGNPPSIPDASHCDPVSARVGAGLLKARPAIALERHES